MNASFSEGQEFDSPRLHQLVYYKRVVNYEARGRFWCFPFANYRCSPSEPPTDVQIWNRRRVFCVFYLEGNNLAHLPVSALFADSSNCDVAGRDVSQVDAVAFQLIDNLFSLFPIFLPKLSLLLRQERAHRFLRKIFRAVKAGPGEI